MRERERGLQKTSSYWVFPSCDIVLVTELFSGSLRGFLLFVFSGENLCLVYLLYLAYLAVLVILSDKDPNQVN